MPLLDEDYLILSTIHSAKGKEWSAVSILNVVDGCLPSDLATGSEDEIEEERRLLYVAMTRAKDNLELLVPQRFYTTGTGGWWRSACLCQSNPFHSDPVAETFRRTLLAAAERATSEGMAKSDRRFRNRAY